MTVVLQPVVSTFSATPGQQLTLKTWLPESSEPTTYQWFRNSQPIAGAVQPTYTPGAIQAGDSAIWYFQAERGGRSYDGQLFLLVRGPLAADALVLSQVLENRGRQPLAVDSAGNVITRTAEARELKRTGANLAKFDPNGKQVAAFGGFGSFFAPNGVDLPEEITAAAIDPQDNLYVVVTRFGESPDTAIAASPTLLATGKLPPAQSSEIIRIAPDGKQTPLLKTRRGEANFIAPVTAATNAAGTLYLGDHESGRILRWKEDGSTSEVARASFRTAGSQAPVLKELAIDAAGTLYLVSPGERTVVRLHADGTSSLVAGSAGPSTPPGGSVDGMGSQALFWAPSSPAVDAAGNIYLSDFVSVRKVTPQGKVTTVAWLPDAAFLTPDAVVRTLRIGRDGSLYVRLGDPLLRAPLR